MIVNLGCGFDRMEGAVNVDVMQGTSADLLHDLNVFPWPFEDNSFDRAVARDVIEHIVDPIKFLEEVWRILKNGCAVEVRTPNWNHVNSWIDPTHIHHFAPQTFEYFDPCSSYGQRYSFYTKRKFRVMQSSVDNDGNIVVKMEKIT